MPRAGCPRTRTAPRIRSWRRPVPPGRLRAAMNLDDLLIYEDNHLLVLHKPAGELVQGDRTGDPSVLDEAKAWLKARHDRPGNVFLGLVHRLDRTVGGVMVFARTSKAAARLSEQIRARTMEKRYLAIVRGHPSPPADALTSWLTLDHGRSRVVAAETPGALRAELRFETTERGPTTSRLAVELGTGRHHQIRVQLAALGHPIVGDMRYGPKVRLRTRVRSIGLYAVRLAFDHPTRDERMVFECAPAADWPWLPLV